MVLYSIGSRKVPHQLKAGWLNQEKIFRKLKLLKCNKKNKLWWKWSWRHSRWISRKSFINWRLDGWIKRKCFRSSSCLDAAKRTNYDGNDVEDKVINTITSMVTSIKIENIFNQIWTNIVIIWNTEATEGLTVSARNRINNKHPSLNEVSKRQDRYFSHSLFWLTSIRYLKRYLDTWEWCIISYILQWITKQWKQFDNQFISQILLCRSTNNNNQDLWQGNGN